jgi:hypothetical protein
MFSGLGKKGNKNDKSGEESFTPKEQIEPSRK